MRRQTDVFADQVDTPWPLAVRLAESVRDVPPGAVVFDPTIGTGVLIAALEHVIGHEVLGAGTDLDPQRIAALRRARPTWTVGRANSTSPKSTGSSPVWRFVRSNVDLVMLNPPFSFRGGAGVAVVVDGRRVLVSPAAAVVLSVLRDARPRLGMVGVLPVGFFVNARDAPVRALLEAQYDVQKLPLSRRAFSGVVASTVAVRITPRVAELRIAKPLIELRHPLLDWSGCRCVVLRRGTLQLHHLGADLRREDVVHTTDLADAASLSMRARLGPRSVSGHVVLVPRVGKPDPMKIVSISGSFLLSDCVIALSVGSASKSERLGRFLREAVAVNSDLYTGTGAPHVTLGRLVDRLQAVGLVVRASAAPCSCGHDIRQTA